VKRLAVGGIIATALAPFLVVALIAAALYAGSQPHGRNGTGRLVSVEGVDPEVLRIVSAVTDTTVATNPGCDADPLLILAHMTIEWPPGLKGEGRNNSRMAANGDFYPIIQAYAPVPGPDRDHGTVDGSTTAEYAVGPLQQINAFRESYPRDGNNDGTITQNNLHDATAIGVQHACTVQADTGQSLQTDNGRALEAGHYMLPSAPTSTFTAEYRSLVADAYNDLASRATWTRPPVSPGNALIVGDYAFPVDPSLITNGAQLTAPHHNYPAWDFPIPVGTTVFTVTAGRVVFAGWSDACGNGVTIDAPDGGRYTYCHGTTVTVEPGVTVTAGQAILLSGSTGHSTGPHLHLQIQIGGRFVCPQPLLLALIQGETLTPAAYSRTDCVRD